MSLELRNMLTADLGSVNALLVQAFSPEWQKERDDSAVLPFCSPKFLKFYLDEMPDNCWVAVSDKRIRAAVFAHRRGETGWLGPLAVSPAWQGRGIGRKITRRAIRGLQEAGCRCIGLETNAQSNNNLGFYSRLGFVAGPLAVDLSLSRIGAGKLLQRNVSRTTKRGAIRSAIRLGADLMPRLECRMFSRDDPVASRQFIAQAKILTQSVDAATDYSRLIEKTNRHEYGESFLYFYRERAVLYATVQTGAVAVGERLGVCRLLALTASDEIGAAGLLTLLCDLAHRTTPALFIVRIPAFHSHLLPLWAKHPLRFIHLTVRMYLQGYEERPPVTGWHLNKWE